MMDERERRDIMLRAIHRYGEAAQIDMAVEEMAELTKALCKVKRATPGATTTAAIANVIEEIADVQIMLDQLRLIFARSTDEVEEDKLRRLLGRLNSYTESNLHDWLNKQPEPGLRAVCTDCGLRGAAGVGLVDTSSKKEEKDHE